MKIADFEVELIDHMGNDLRVANAARVSMAKQSEWDFREERPLPGVVIKVPTLKQKDAGLIRYLAEHKHWTPFAHNVASFRIKAPIFIRAQLWKHVVGLNIAAELPMNEVSRRYVDDEPEFWFPQAWRKQAENVKQGSSDEVIENNDAWRASMIHAAKVAARTYEEAIAAGICPEQARMILPQNMMTEWWWTGSLAAFARVCALRLDPHAQRECGEVAGMIADELRQLWPHAFRRLLGEALPAAA